jgi:hypothetical protein
MLLPLTPPLLLYCIVNRRGLKWLGVKRNVSIDYMISMGKRGALKLSAISAKQAVSIKCIIIEAKF